MAIESNFQRCLSIGRWGPAELSLSRRNSRGATASSSCVGRRCMSPMNTMLRPAPRSSGRRGTAERRNTRRTEFYVTSGACTRRRHNPLRLGWLSPLFALAGRDQITRFSAIFDLRAVTPRWSTGIVRCRACFLSDCRRVDRAALGPLI